MANIIEYSMEVYTKHITLILLFSLAFIIAFAIPIFASFPTFNDMGGIFLRIPSTFTNLNAFTAGVIVVATVFSLLFLSFAIAAISLIVKHSRTATRMKKEVINGLEKHTSRVFVVLLLYTAILEFLSIAAYAYGITQVIPSVIGLLITPFFFYAPASIVIDEKGVIRAMQLSAKVFVKNFQYVLLLLFSGIVALTVFDFIFILIGGTMLSSYLMLIFTSIIIMPFFVVLQCEAYMRRFALLRR
ncbi:MAG: hypothetical protein M1504_01030 [Candidatus Marsarchaeota archaeon]|nr:hypothetical protein [Candidatus Marsarchaeota archaeon]